MRNPAGDAVRSLYMTNDIVKQIVAHNDFVRMRLMTAGTKVFAKQEGTEAKRAGVDAQFRVLAEGLPVVLPHIDPAAILEADAGALRVLMQAYYPLTAGFEEPFRSVLEAQGECVRECTQSDGAHLRLDTGSHVVRFLPGQAENAT